MWKMLFSASFAALVANLFAFGGASAQPPGWSEIIGSLSNFDAHQGCFEEADNFELDFTEPLDPEDFTGYYHGWGIPPRFDDIRFGGAEHGVEVLWLDRAHPIPFCNWVHFGVTVNPRIPPTGVQAYWTRIRKVAQIPVPFQWWLIEEQGILTDVLTFSQTFDQGPVIVIREWAFADNPIPLEELQFDTTPVDWMFGDDFIMYPGDTRPLPLPIPTGAQAGLVRYTVQLMQNPDIMTRFVTEAVLSPDRQFIITSVLVNFDLHNTITGSSFDNLELDFFGDWLSPSMVRWWYDLDQIPPPHPPYPAWGVDPLLRRFPAGLFPGMPGGLEVTWLDKYNTFDYCETYHFGLEFDPSVMQGRRLYASDSQGVFYWVDHTTGIANPICTLPTGTTEIEYNFVTGKGILQDVDGMFTHQEFDITNCVPLGPVIPNGWSFNGLEYVGNTLYGAGIQASCAPSSLCTLDPITGAVAVIGPTGLGPISGLAYDPGTQTMYGVTGCYQAFGPAQRVTISLTNGAATVIGPMGPIAMGSLEFGPDGRLYAIGANAEGGNFYRINPANGAATLIGPTGFPGFTGLALAPGGQGQFPSVQAYWTQIDTCQVPVPWQFWRAIPGGRIRDIIRLSNTWPNGPVLIDRQFAAVPETVPLDELTWENTGDLPWVQADPQPVPIAPGDTLILDIGYSWDEPSPETVDSRDHAVFVRYRVMNQGEEELTRFINEALILPADPAAAPEGAPIQRGMKLEENVPNPFRSETMFIYRLDQTAEVTLTIYDVSGRLVSEIAQGRQSPGRHGARWVAADLQGRKLPAGVYLAVLKAGDQRSERKILLAE